ncbi:hypothetical protein B0H12DRAFT_1233880 [Mycena haematopus]|nr:hypothetical protein B0H12DRAFT_1233880 [Mycena haematopus]
MDASEPSPPQLFVFQGSNKRKQSSEKSDDESNASESLRRPVRMVEVFPEDARAHIATLDAEIMERKEQIAAYKQATEDDKTEPKLRAEIDEQKKDLVSSVDKNALLIAENQQLQEDDDRHLEQIEDLMDKLEASDINIKNLQQEEERYKELNTRLVVDKTELQRTLDECKADSIRHQEAAHLFAATHKDCETRNHELEEVRALNARLAVDKTELQKTLDECKADSTRHQEAAHLFAATHKDCETRNHELEEVKGLNTRLAVDKTELQKTLDECKADSTRHQEAAHLFAATHKDCETLRGQVSNLEALNHELKEKQDLTADELNHQVETAVSRRVEEIGAKVLQECKTEYTRRTVELESKFAQQVQAAVEERVATEPVIKLAQQQLHGAQSMMDKRRAEMEAQFAVATKDLTDYRSSTNKKITELEERNQLVTRLAAFCGFYADVCNADGNDPQGGSSTTTPESRNDNTAMPVVEPPPIPSQSGSSVRPGGQSQSQNGQIGTANPDVSQRILQQGGSSTPPGGQSTPPGGQSQIQHGPGHTGSANPDVKMPDANSSVATPLQGGSGGSSSQSNPKAPSTPPSQGPDAQSNGQLASPEKWKPQRRPPMLARRKPKAARPSDQADALTAFRKFTHEHLGITKDKDIDKLLLTRATPEELAAFEDNGLEPKLRDGKVYPLHMNIEEVTHSAWNAAVGELVITAFLKTRSATKGGEQAEEEDEDEDGVVDDNFLRKLWGDRLKSIKRAQTDVMRAIKDPQYTAMVSESARRQTHRTQLFSRRQRSGQLSWSEGVQRKFAVLFDAIGGQVMSSDEEVGPQKRKKTCQVIRKDWRHNVLINLLKWLDYNADHHKLTASGSSQGPSPHPRIRSPAGKDTKRTEQYIKGLPVNLYCPNWLATLSKAQMAALCPKDAIDLPLEVLEWETNVRFEVDENDKDEFWRPPPKQNT